MIVDDETLRFPPRGPEPQRPGLPVLAAVAPVVGAVVLWQVMGSPHALWFAALGPLVMMAGYLDGIRSQRRARRRDRAARTQALDEVEERITRIAAQQRARLWERHPDVAGFREHQEEIWRSVPGRAGVMVVGAGTVASPVRLEGDAGDARGHALVQQARRLEDAPVSVALTAGVAVVGPDVLVDGVVRALLAQLLLVHPPGNVRLRGGAEELSAYEQSAEGLLIVVADAERPLPPDVDIPLVRVRPGEPVPPRCGAVVTLTGGHGAQLSYEGTRVALRVEAISAAQAASTWRVLAARAAALGTGSVPSPPLAELPAAPVEGGSLAGVIGTASGEPLALDLVREGPHAIVIGVTGSGKSELLISWVVAMARGRSPRDLSFLLVDFKGGRTFAALEGLPHVTGVLTDLNDAEALRAVQSLRAEIRRRETVLADLDARDVDGAGGTIGRLVVVVDEFAALVAAHPELHELFADLAARGRALGIHLILASQRAAGAFREGLLANAPLRIALRVNDGADARAILGSGAAAQLSGHPDARGTALVRRPTDAAPLVARIAQCDDAVIARVAAHTSGERGFVPWMPALATRIPLSELVADAPSGTVILGRADEPDRQRQPVLTLEPRHAAVVVVGGPGSGKTMLVDLIAQQCQPDDTLRRAARLVRVGPDPEAAWDAVHSLETAAPGSTYLIDDADALVARMPPDYAAAWAATLERAAREARSRGIRLVFSVARTAGPLARCLELIPTRAILGLSSRADHVAAGGEAADFIPDIPAGRGRWGRVSVQFAQSTPLPPVRVDPPPRWQPGDRVAGLVLPPGTERALLGALGEAGHRVAPVEDATADATADGATVRWGTPEAWLGAWRTLAQVRAEGELLIDARCATEYRALSGSRELPPLALAGAGRAWQVRAGEEPRRVLW